MDAHLVEEKIIQENQKAAYNKFSKTLTAYEERQSKFQDSTSEIKEKIVDCIKNFHLESYAYKLLVCYLLEIIYFSS